MTTFERTREYDRFGPWVDEVHEPDDVPRLYRDHPVDFASARLILKVPRNIARRDATPNMDLYDHLLVAGPRTLLVLSRLALPRRRGSEGPTNYSSHEVGYADIVAVRNRVNLLDATLSITRRDGSALTVPYNGSAANVITGLVDVLRASFERGRALGVVPSTRQDPLGERDAALMADFTGAARRVPGLTPWAWHERRTVKPRQTGAQGLVRRVVHAGHPMTLHGAVLGADEVAFEAFGRREWLVRGGTPELSSGRLVVPIAAIDAVERGAHPDYAGVAVVTVRSGGARTIMHLPEDSDTLRALAVAFPER